MHKAWDLIPLTTENQKYNEKLTIERITGKGQSPENEKRAQTWSCVRAPILQQARL